MAMTLGCTVAELQTRMSAREFAEWKAFHRVEPVGPDRSDIQTGAMLSAMTGADFKDVVPQWWRKQEGQSIEEMQAIIRQAVADAEAEKQRTAGTSAMSKGR